MLDRDTRIAILRLHAEGHGCRTIARAVGVSRNAARDVIRRGDCEVPAPKRPEKVAAHLERIRALYAECKGNLVRVREKLADEGTELAYSTLTAFCRRHEIGRRPKRPVGQYHFDPGEEMQHDTSPHRVMINGVHRLTQCASLVLCFSRMVFVQVYPRFTRFECRLFLAKALEYFGGAAVRCMVDNTSVIRARGTGKDMVPAAEMQVFSERFGFEFEAHERGDANRSARVERRFYFIETNFYPGRTFQSFADLNAQAILWCDTVNQTYRRALRASALELFAAERPTMQPLPIYIPEVYQMHFRRADVQGYVCLHTNRYSVPVNLIGRTLQVRETEDRIYIKDGHRLVAEHQKVEPGGHCRSTLEEHRETRPPGQRRRPPPAEEGVLRAASPVLGELVDALKKRHGGHAMRTVRRLHKIYLDYPTEAVVEAISRALDFGLTDLGRIERMVLKLIGSNFFKLPLTDTDDPEDDDG